MARPAAEIALVGMKETRKALRDFGADSGWREPLRDAYREVADDVAAEGRSRAARARPTLGGSSATMGNRAISSITGKGTTTEARIVAFRGVPWGPGWNFGSKGRFRQFPVKAVPDYNLYTTIADRRERISETFADRIGDALERAYPD
jgi:hypothetical protein